jgi:hypothetical protein
MLRCALARRLVRGRFFEGFVAIPLTLALVAGCEGGDASLAPGAPFAVAVAARMPGPGGGFGEDALPDIVLGAPRGAGLSAGSRDVLSLGTGGSITLELGAAVIDGPGPDFVVFENPFRILGSPTNVFVEPGHVAVSEDGETWVDFPCDGRVAPYRGCAGLLPVAANVDTNTHDPRDPAAAGGDVFDLADVGVSRARFVRITDAGGGRMDGAGTDGFDLDAIAVIHAEGG